MELTIEITNYCPHTCNYCSTACTSEWSTADRLNYWDDIIESLEELRAKGTKIDLINLSGGEPLSHPDFWNILKLCKSYAPVRVYTNALDNIAFNSDVIKNFKIAANVVVEEGKETQIPIISKEIKFLKLTPAGRAKGKKVDFEITSSGHTCTECENPVWQANGKIVKAPCKKDY